MSVRTAKGNMILRPIDQERNETPGKPLNGDELERVRRRLMDVLPTDDAVRLLATVDALRWVLGATAEVPCYGRLRTKLRCFPSDMCSSCRARRALGRDVGSGLPKST